MQISPRPVSTSKTLTLLLAAFLLCACSLGAGQEATPSSAADTTLPAPEQATPTQSAVAAIVNGEEISLASYERHLAFYQQAQEQAGTLLATEEVEATVLNDLVDRLLLAQEAREAGFSADQATVDERLNDLIDEAGGQETFDAWLATNSFPAEDFRQELALEIEAGWMRQQITDGVPTTAEQVLARQILLSDEFQAQRLLDQLESGTPFETVVINNDPQRLGTLGWFPRGYLLQEEVEEAAFALQVGEFSQIVETELGYHLIEVLDRQSDRELDPQARLQLQLQALQDWLAEQRAASSIQLFLP